MGNVTRLHHALPLVPSLGSMLVAVVFLVGVAIGAKMVGGW